MLCFVFLHTDNLQHRAKVRQAMTGDQEWSSKYISKVFPMMERLENVLLKLDSKSSLEQTNTGGGHNLVFYILNIICHVRLKIFFNLHFSRLTSILMLPILIPLISRSDKTNIYFMLLFIFIKICVGFFFKLDTCTMYLSFICFTWEDMCWKCWNCIGEPYYYLYVLGVYEICCTEKPLKELPNTKGDGQLLGTFSTLIGSLNTCVYTIKHV